MRHPTLVFVMIFTLLLASCGKEYHSQPMTNSDAMDTLANVPMTGGRSAVGGSGMSVDELNAVIQKAVMSGKARGLSRDAVASGVDLSALNQIFGLLQGTGGQTPSILGLATGLMNLNGGSTAVAGSKLSGILGILNAVAPIIATIAPQYAGVITALTTIIPVVVSIFSMFKRKPKPSPTAALLWEPIFA